MNNQLIENHCITPSMFRLDGGAMFGIIPKPLWQKHVDVDELNRIDLSLRLWLIRSKNRTVLIDTGIGEDNGEQFNDRFDVRAPEAPLEKALEQIGLKCSDITDLVLSHLHFDHVGGLGKIIKDKNTRIFPQARLHLHKKHFEYALSPTARDKGSFHTHNFLPLIKEYEGQDNISWYDKEEGILIPELNLNYKCSHGHTPFLMHPFSDEFIYLADLIPTSSHIPIAWVMGYDIYPGRTVHDKEVFLNMILENNLKIIFEHDPDYWGCTVKKDEKGRICIDEKFTHRFGEQCEMKVFS